MRVFPVAARTDVVVASGAAREIAIAWGLGRRRAIELAIVVAELASNVVKHAKAGEVTLAYEPEAGPRGELVVVAKDAGPPIHDLATAMIDGCDDRGPIDPAVFLGRNGLGTGLGAVARLADSFDCVQTEAGKSFTACFRL